MKKQLSRLSALCMMLLCSAWGMAETITATWDFTNADVVAAVNQ